MALLPIGLWTAWYGRYKFTKNQQFSVTQARLDKKHGVRYAAALSWDGNEDTLNAAVSKLESTCKEHGWKTPANPRRDIHKYHVRLGSRGNVDSDSHQAGRHPLISDEGVQSVVGSMKNWKKAGEAKQYPSVAVLKQKVPEAATVIKQAGVSDAAVCKCIRKLGSAMKRIKQSVKKQLTEAHTGDRVKTAQSRKRVPMKQQKAWVYIDAKSMKMEVATSYGWVDTANETDVAALQHAKSRSSGVPVLDYYIAVGYYVGPLDLYYYTGTTGLKADRGPVTFRVR
jgi:hypothetical protein